MKIGAAVLASLRTKDPALAKERHSIADAVLRGVWDAARNGPTRLTPKNAVAISKGAYDSSVVDAEVKNEGELASALSEIWPRLGDVIRSAGSVDAFHDELIAVAARAGGDFRWTKFAVGTTPPDVLESGLGPMADKLLAQKGLVIDAPSRRVLLREIQRALEDADAKVTRGAVLGDFTPDPAASRFPEYEAPSPSKPDRPDLLFVSELFGRYKEAREGIRAASTFNRYRASIASLAAYFPDRDARSLTDADIHSWAIHRRDKEKIRASVINRNDLVAVSSLFRWAKSLGGGRLVQVNPVSSDVRLEEPRDERTQGRPFADHEAKAILRAALAVAPTPKNPTMAYARRWAPWIAAYSGARISEITNLHSSEIRRDGNAWIMFISKSKTGTERTVPLHEHLIEMGFLDFVRSRGKHPLFFDPSRHDADSTTGPGEMRGMKVAAWVRKTVKLPPNVDSNHAWRHSFKTICARVDVGITERLSDAITGHAQTKVARRYETPSVADMAAAMARFPRYAVP